MDSATLLWIALPVVVLTALILDLFVFHRSDKEIPTREAFIWTGIWAGLGIAFGVAIWVMLGPTVGTEFFTGYLVEYSLSIDNVAVFAILFAALAVPNELRYRALFWGVIMAIVLRGVLIGIGGALLEAFWWMPFIFGAFLIITGIRMARHTDTTEHPEDSKILTLMRRVIPMTEDFRGSSMTVKENGKRLFTPLFVALLALAFFDLMFAVDSVPAIYAITKEPMIVFTSNIFAILGLRAMFFLLAGVVHKFRFLKYGLGLVLVFVGLKMVWLNQLFGGHFPIGWSLTIISVLIGSSIAASFLIPPKKES